MGLCYVKIIQSLNIDRTKRKEDQNMSEENKVQQASPQEIQMVIITGMSGAGKTVAIQSFEDLGYFCVDNLPPTLLPKFLELMKESGSKMNRVALVMDLRGREFFDHLFQALDDLAESTWLTPQILFLDAKDATLVTRYKETRR